VAAAVALRLYRLTMDRSQQAGQQTITLVIHLAVEGITLHPKNKWDSAVATGNCAALERGTRINGKKRNLFQKRRQTAFSILF
jgi:hypothetical protein